MDVPPRIVTIKSIELLNIVVEEFTEVEITITCSPGTYIRSIARDLGEILGVGGTLAHLIRTESCGMNLADSITFTQLEAQLQQNSWTLISPNQALAHLPRITLNSEQARYWCQGQAIEISPQEYLNIASRNINKQLFNLSQYYLTKYSQEEIFLGISTLLENRSPVIVAPKIVCATL